MKNSSKPIVTACAAAFTLFNLSTTPAQAGPGSCLYLNSYVNSEFDNPDQYVTVADNDLLTFTNAFTWEAWINVTRTNWPWKEEWLTILAKDRFADECWFPLFQDGSFDVRFANQNFILERNASTTVPFQIWQHVAVTWDNTNVCCYVNGDLKQTQPFSGSIGNSSAPLVIGRDAQQGYHFTGFIDEVRLWNVARSQADIQSAMRHLLTGAENGLVAYWPFDEGAGTVATNHAALTGSACDGTLVNAPAWAPGVESALYLSNCSLLANHISFDMNSVFTRTAVLEACTNLAAPVWAPVQTNVLSGTPVSYTDPAAATQPSGFYRLRSQ